MNYKSPPQEEEIPFQIAPMIDIVFQLLIFFIMTMKLQDMEFAKEVSLPVAKLAMERKAEGYLEIRINVLPNGDIKVGDTLYKPDQLTSALIRESAAGAKGIERKVLIRGDRNAHYGRMMRIMAACAEANIWNVSFSTYNVEPRSFDQ